jgi:hypothetical protein
MRRHGGKGLQVSVTELPAPVPGGVGLRIQTSGVQSGQTVGIDNDVLVFVRGPASVSLSTLSGPGTFPPDLQRHLTDVLVQRADKYIPQPSASGG